MNTFIYLSLYIYVNVFIMYIFLACMIETFGLMSIYILTMTHIISSELSMFVACVVVDS